MNYKISVIIPVYNAENSLEKAIESIMNQTIGFNNIQLILVDDKSTDGSKKIIENYEKNYENIIAVFLNKNSGLPGKPRTIGIKYAEAEYLMFLDADDEYCKNAFEIFYNCILKEKSDFIIGNYYFNFDGNMVKSNFKFKINENEDLINFNPMESQETFDKLSYDHIGPWGKIFRKSLIIDNNIEFPDDCLCEDTYFYFKSLINSKKVTLLPNTYIYIYNTFENKKTAIHMHDLKKFKDFYKGIFNLNTLLKNIKLSPQITISNNIGNLLLIFTNMSNKDKKTTIKEIYNLEKQLDCNIIIDKKEVSILNETIMRKHFTIAILISNLYKLLYNNKNIKELYRKINNKRIKS